MEPLRVDLDLNYKKKYDRHINLGRFLYNNKLVRKILFRLKRIMDTLHTDYVNYSFDAGEPDMSMGSKDYVIRTVKDVTGHSNENRFIGLKFLGLSQITDFLGLSWDLCARAGLADINKTD